MSQPKEQALIEQIKAGKLTERELINLYNNASSRGAVAVVEAIKLQMRGQFPKAANRIFGAKETQAVALLESANKKLSAELDLSGNKIKNGVKPGGAMLSGEKYINVYMSYKNKDNFGAYLSFDQQTADSELIATVANYKTGAGAFEHEQSFGVPDFDKAVAIYKSHLLNIIPTS